MLVTQVAQLANTITKEILGESGVVSEDLSNVVDVGTQILNLGENGVDNYCKALVNQIGRMIFVDRPYRGHAPSVLMDGWQYGSILEKVRTVLPNAEENDTWQLVDGQSYDQDIFYQPDATAKFFNSRVTFEIPRSFCFKQIEESFQNGQQLNAFFSMLYNAVEKSMTVKLDSLIMRTINTMIFSTIRANVGNDETTSTPARVNLLQMYNALGNSLSFKNALNSEGFLKFASYIMSLYVDRISSLSVNFNISMTDKFTPSDMLHFILLSDFAKASDVYLQSGTFHNELTKLPKYETVPYWQSQGDFTLQQVGGLDITAMVPRSKSDLTPIKTSFSTFSRDADGNPTRNMAILGVMFDRDALGVTNLDRRVTTHYNAKGEFWNNFFKFEAGYFNDWDENFVVFYISEKINTTQTIQIDNPAGKIETPTVSNTPVAKAKRI